MTDIFILGTARTAVGRLGGSLQGSAPTELAATVARAAIQRSGLAPEAVDNSVFGNVIPTDARDLYLGRVAAVQAGVPIQAPGLTVNRLCGSGAQSIISAAQAIRLGESGVSLAGGAEVMSRAPFSVEGLRFGRRIGNGVVYDWLHNTFQDPFGHGLMGATGENVAERFGIGREPQDRFALESQARAARAIAEGRFAGQIVGIEVAARRSTVTFDTDEHVRGDTTLEELARLKPSFRDGGTVTAGNSSGINDGAAALVLASGEEVDRRRLVPSARLLSWALVGVSPELMGLGPVDAVPLALARAGITADEVDVVELNEAFAAQALAVIDKLGIDEAKYNPNGGAIALGHPLGATGTILVVKAVHELHRQSGRYAVVTLCIGGGQGVALVIERVA